MLPVPRRPVRGEDQRLHFRAEREIHAGGHGVGAAERDFVGAIADVVHDVGIVPRAAHHGVAEPAVEQVVVAVADQQIRAVEAEQAVGAGAADDAVVERVAGADMRRAGQRQHLDIGQRRVVDAGHHRVARRNR